MIRIVISAPLDAMLGLEGHQPLDLAGPARSLRDLFAELAATYPGFAELADPSPKSPQRGTMIVVDGRVIPGGERRLETMVEDGSEVALFAPYRGG